MASSELRQMVDRRELIVAPGIIDPLGAKLIQHLGFKVAYMGGWSSGAHLGITEPLLTMTEQLEMARLVTNAIHIPLIVDGAAGFGEPLHLRRAVREYEAAGISGMHIEDQQHPKRAHYHKGVEAICDRDSFIKKIEVAVASRGSTDFVVIARTDAAKAVNGSVDEAVWRCNAALDAGADVVMPLVKFPNVGDPWDQLREIRAQLPENACVAIISGHLKTLKELPPLECQKAGFSMIMYPVMPAVVQLGALESLYRPLAEEGKLAESGYIGFEVGSYRRVQDLTEELLGLEEMYEFEESTVGQPE
jgi:2-methylisocitrate lyase-like PEP mutase family enzyme